MASSSVPFGFWVVDYREHTENPNWTLVFILFGIVMILTALGMILGHAFLDDVFPDDDDSDED